LVPQEALDLGEPSARSGLGYLYLHGLVNASSSSSLDSNGASSSSASPSSSSAAAAAEAKAEAEAQERARMTRRTADDLQALALFRTGAAAGDAAALNGMGLLYQQGRAVTRDLAEAKDHFKVRPLQASPTGPLARVLLAACWQHCWPQRTVQGRLL
jgi:TPR repeat protein